MKTTNIKQIAFTAVAGLFLTACGGGDSDDNYTPPPSTAILVPACETSAADVTGKTIKKIEDGAIVKILHETDGTRTACMITGQAEII